MRQGRGGQRSKKCCNRRVAPPISLPATLEDPGVSWKGPPPGDPNAPFNSAPSFGSGPPPPGGYQGQFQGPPAGSPAGSGPYAPGSSTPQYTASPAPSGSSTPGPGPPQFPPPPTNSSYNGPGPFGSPSSSGPNFVGRPGSSGPFGPPGGNPHFGGPGAQFGGHQFGMPPGSPFGHGPLPGPIPGHGMMPGQMPPGPVDRIDQGRHTPYFGQPDYRIYELNKRLQQRTDESDNLWWDAFATEFFEDDATLTITFCLEDGPKRYTIGRTLIPRYFRSIFEGGVTELYYNLKHPKESFHNTSITLDCDQCTMVTHHGKPMFTKWSGDRGSVEPESYCQVCTEGRLILEFTFDDLMRIKSWHMAVRNHRELVPRSVMSLHTQGQDPQVIDQLSKNITRQGITNSTLNYLRLCVILEPMQELMSRHKAYALSPRDCLKTTLFQKWQRMVAPPVIGGHTRADMVRRALTPDVAHRSYQHPVWSQDTRSANRPEMYVMQIESQRPANKRRKRKGSQSGGAANSAPPAPNKKRSPGPNFSLASQDVMVVGEPSLMGGEFGDEDERLITRLENTQYDGANSLDHDPHFGDSPLAQANSWGGPGAPEPRSAPANTPSSQDSGDKKSPAAFFDQSNPSANALNNGVCKNV